MSESERPASRFTEQFGGVKGLVDSGLPVVVFVGVNAFAGLHWAIGAAIAAGLVVLAARLVRREPVQFAVSGFLGVAVAAFFAWRLGGARGFFIPGIVLSAGYCVAFAVSLLVRRPLVGVLWTYLDSGDRQWRDNRMLRRAYTQATLIWTAMYAAKVVVQGLLYLHNRPGWLAVAKLAMGYPLFAAVAAATVWLVRRGKAAAAREAGAAVDAGTASAGTVS
ncbi:MAG: DUF3159 domain-containing protein [Actinomycetota bacterium]|nr:DUF3159 domain-containing protein [Actinomycetota bacterium]